MSFFSTSPMSLSFIESLWEKYLDDPTSVSDEWRNRFQELEQSEYHGQGQTAAITVGRMQLAEDSLPQEAVCQTCGKVPAMAFMQQKVSELTRNFRVRGHRVAKVNPLGGDMPEIPELEPSFYGFTEQDMDVSFRSGSAAKSEPRTLREILERLRTTYCGLIGVQFMHIDDQTKRDWLQQRMEETTNHIRLDRDQQLRIFTRLTDAVIFEQFVQRKFVGAKSFSLEGAESLIPLLDMAIEKVGDHGVERVVIGMPHRGRLNVLTNIMGKHPRKIFNEFKDSLTASAESPSDVKYHLGYHRDYITSKGHKLHLDLLFNPSHLEFVGPVAQGVLRAEQDAIGDFRQDRGLLVIIHGDASMAGEGIVQETLNLSELTGYEVGGALHVVVNNQIGFTTLPEEGRSSTYATDVARMLQVPIFHVNGENPEAVAQAITLALDFRAMFRSDVVIDMYCYRRRGHNEGDEPSFTQPLMYKKIKSIPTIHESYLNRLLDLGEITLEEATEVKNQRLSYLEREFESTEMDRKSYPALPNAFDPKWEIYRKGSFEEAKKIDTAVPRARLSALLEMLAHVPDDFSPNKKMANLLDKRKQMAKGELPLDWGAGEALAFATLLSEGKGVRLSGQDSQRGTFSHRHAVLHDENNGSTYMPLAYVAPDQGRVEIVNSPLSEGAVLGFEYGYSTVNPEYLVVWEAQFGDFANVAQVYIDQFISAGEVKWQILSGLTLFLPHGLEGTGPEHASARLERFLSLAAQDNYQVVMPTTPAQIFHLLRRQVHMRQRKPLVVMSPKSMLRHREAVSSLEELAEGRFQEIIRDPSVELSHANRVILTSGKIYYDLVAKRRSLGLRDVAIVRIEQLYPLDFGELSGYLKDFKEGKPVVWVQEEPANMGAKDFLRIHWSGSISEKWTYHEVSREASPSPATGSAAIHKQEQEELLERAFLAIN